MRFARNKKSSLDISLSAIVIVVLAMTFLGLGLVFIRNMFSGITETTLSVQDQIRQQILDDLRTGDKKLSFPTNEVRINHGDSKVLAIGVKNTAALPLDFAINLEDVTSGDPPQPISLSDAGNFIWDSAGQTLGVNEANVYPIKLEAGNDPGTYIIKIRIEYYSSGDEYASKSFFVTVT